MPHTVYVPLSISPTQAHDETWPSRNRILDKFREHMANLVNKNYNDADMALVTGTALDARPIYMRKDLPQGMPPAQTMSGAYPDWNLSTFMGVIKFTAPTQEAWEKVEFCMRIGRDDDGDNDPSAPPVYGRPSSATYISALHWDSRTRHPPNP